MRNLLFNLHWLLGLTLGTVLAISGVTGGLMAFSPELLSWANGINEPAEKAADHRLSVPALYEKILAQSDGYRVVKLVVFSNPDKLGQVELSSNTTSAAPGAFPARPEMHLVNPYSGELLPRPAFGVWLESAMAWLRKVHEGHWFEPGNPLSKPVWTSFSVAAFSLFFVGLSGLYLRWPRGQAAKKWQSWLKINFHLKGRVFLRSLHMVVGTVLLLAYLVSAHTGTFQSTPLSWYGKSVRSLLGQPQAENHRPPPPPADAANLQAEKPPVSVNKLLPLLTAARTVVRSEKWTLELDSESPVLIGESSGMIFRVSTDPQTDEVQKEVLTPPTDGDQSFARMLVERNQSIHEGRIFGISGVIVMMIAAFSMPVFYVTGWMMYLQRRKSNT